MGGYRNSKPDPLPGHEVMWRGYTRLPIWAITYQAFGAIYDMVERPPPNEPDRPSPCTNPSVVLHPRSAPEPHVPHPLAA